MNIYFVYNKFFDFVSDYAFLYRKSKDVIRGYSIVARPNKLSVLTCSVLLLSKFVVLLIQKTSITLNSKFMSKHFFFFNIFR